MVSRFGGVFDNTTLLRTTRDDEKGKLQSRGCIAWLFMPRLKQKSLQKIISAIPAGLEPAGPTKVVSGY
jgi:hypothetical protein